MLILLLRVATLGTACPHTLQPVQAMAAPGRRRWSTMNPAN